MIFKPLRGKPRPKKENRKQKIKTLRLIIEYSFNLLSRLYFNFKNSSVKYIAFLKVKILNKIRRYCNEKHLSSSFLSLKLNSFFTHNNSPQENSVVNYLKTLSVVNCSKLFKLLSVTDIHREV